MLLPVLWWLFRRTVTGLLTENMRGHKVQLDGFGPVAAGMLGQTGRRMGLPRVPMAAKISALLDRASRSGPCDRGSRRTRRYRGASPATPQLGQGSSERMTSVAGQRARGGGKRTQKAAAHGSLGRPPRLTQVVILERSA